MIARKILVLALVVLLPGTSPAIADGTFPATADVEATAAPALRPASPAPVPGVAGLAAPPAAVEPDNRGPHPATTAAVLLPGTMAGTQTKLDLTAGSAGLGVSPRLLAGEFRVRPAEVAFTAADSPGRLAVEERPAASLASLKPATPAPQADRESSWRRNALIWGLVFAGAAGGAALAISLNRDNLRNQTKSSAVGPGNFP
jgi:hypothetical protein